MQDKKGNDQEPSLKKALQALHDTSPLYLVLLSCMFRAWSAIYESFYKSGEILVPH